MDEAKTEGRVNAPQAAKLMGCSTQIVIRLIKSGRLAALDLETGKHHFWTIRPAGIEALRYQPEEKPPRARYRRRTQEPPFRRSVG